MIIGIILAVLALLAIVFLIAFNIRASSSPRKTDAPDSPSPLSSVPVPVQKEEPKVQSTTKAEKRTEPRADAHKSTDEEYRQALRQMFQNEKEQENESDSPDSFIGDNEYRAAMRSISKKKQE